MAQDKRYRAGRRLRGKISALEDPAFTADICRAGKTRHQEVMPLPLRINVTAIARFEEVVVGYPRGHARRRQDIPGS